MQHTHLLPYNCSFSVISFTQNKQRRWYVEGNYRFPLMQGVSENLSLHSMISSHFYCHVFTMHYTGIIIIIVSLLIINFYLHFSLPTARFNEHLRDSEYGTKGRSGFRCSCTFRSPFMLHFLPLLSHISFVCNIIHTCNGFCFICNNADANTAPLNGTMEIRSEGQSVKSIPPCSNI